MSSRPLTDYVYRGEDLVKAPYQVFETIRKDGELVWCEGLKNWLITSRTAATEILKSDDFVAYDLISSFTRLQSRLRVDLSPILGFYAFSPFLLEGERHEKLRLAFNRVTRKIAPEYAAELTKLSKELLREMLAKDEADFAADYAHKLHVLAVSRVFGIPDEKSEIMCNNATSVGSIDLMPRIPEILRSNNLVVTLMAQMMTYVEQAADTPILVWLREELATLGLAETDRDTAYFLCNLLVLGRDTLSGTLTLGLEHMLSLHNGEVTRDTWNDVHCTREEFLRLSSSVLLAKRTAIRDTSLVGQAIAMGETVTIFLSAANRDPSGFECPHEFRKDHPAHLAFGQGRHTCAGRASSITFLNTILPHLASLDRITERPGKSMASAKTIRTHTSFPVHLEGNI